MATGLVPVTVVTGGPEAPLLSSRIRAGAGLRPVSLLTSKAVGSTGSNSVWLKLEPVEGYRTFGCRCCQVRLDLVEGLRMLIERRVRPDRVVVLLDPLCDISTALQTLLSDPDLGRLISLDGVIATTDAVALSTR